MSEICHFKETVDLLMLVVLIFFRDKKLEACGARRAGKASYLLLRLLL